jgi:ABC-2 type transport system ATP-binding protein
MTGYAVETTGLSKAYGPKTVLAGIDLTVARGSVFALLGPNGAGKTTVVRILATLQPPDGGQVRVAGHDVVGEPAAVRRAISLTGQYAAVDEQLTAEENLLLMGRLRRLGRTERRRRTAELLDLLELTADARRRVKTYSGGMKRKVDLAMSLIARPEVLFLDEPTTGLDPRSRQAVWDVVGELVGSGVTIFLTTQYLEEADRLADRIAVLDGGAVVATGSADELKRRVGIEQVELALSDPAGVERTRELLGAGVVAVPGTPVVRVATDGTADHLRYVLDTLAGAGVAVSTATVHRPTLEDVFLTLTGTARPGTDRPGTDRPDTDRPDAAPALEGATR